MASPSSLERAGSPYAARNRGSRDGEPPREKSNPGLFGSVSCFFSETVWSEARPRRGLRGLFYRVCRILHLCVRGFIQDDCVFRASALTYITVLSLVPLLAFSFSVAQGFGFYEKLVADTINPFLDSTFGPVASGGALVPDAPAQSHEIRVAVDRVLAMAGSYVKETKVASLGALGLVILLWAVLKLLGTIERSFNHIWGVQRPRSIVRKFSDYLAMVIVAPIFLFTATAVTAAAESHGVTEILREKLHLGLILDLLVKAVPLIALWLGFTFVYLVMPNARTRIVSAVIGAIVGGSLWHLTLLLHIKFQVGVANYNAIYASFAAIPIFLVWIQFSWVAVLVGAEVCFAHQSEPDYLRVARSRPSDHAFKELLAVRAMARIGQRFLSGGPGWTADGLATELAVPIRPMEEVLDLLIEGGVLAVAPTGSQDAFLPARDLDTITVKSVLDALKGTRGPVDVPARTKADHRIDGMLAALNQEMADSPSNATMRNLALAVSQENTEPGSFSRTASSGPENATARLAVRENEPGSVFRGS
ncbi:MAG: YihY/virulence factor BrkB family protein [Planctomycetota bacterium]